MRDVVAECDGLRRELREALERIDELEGDLARKEGDQ